ncbi:MAG: sigma-70 family RNA polymerase sigma factor [Planctomycetota bacterium]
MSRLEGFLDLFSERTSYSLIEGVRQKDEDAWNSLNQLYAPLVAYWCQKAGVPADDVEDLVQDVFRAVMRGVEDFRKQSEQGSFRSWLWVITRRKVIDFFKVRRGKAIAAGGTDAQFHIQQLPESEPAEDYTTFGPEEGLAHRALKIVESEIKETTYKAFWRSTIDDVSPAVVAEELGISVDSVYQAKSRVLKRLRELLY